MATRLVLGDCLDVLPTLEAGSVASVVTDPPYALTEPRSGGDGTGQAFAPRTEEMKERRRGGFMGKRWDAALPTVEHWQAVLRVLRPGGYLLSFGGTRTWHRLACALEDAGFEIRDTIMFLYGVGFPKGRGCLKPAYEPILVCRKPGPRVLPLQIDACRVPCEERPLIASTPKNGAFAGVFREGSQADGTTTAGRWPANVVHDGSPEVLEAFAAFGERGGGFATRGASTRIYGGGKGFTAATGEEVGFGDTGTAARFFYCAKASRAERGEGNLHPTVKPLALMRWLCRLVTPPGEVCLDPFLGSGTTGLACALEGFGFVGIEREAEYLKIAERRIASASADCPLFGEVS